MAYREPLRTETHGDTPIYLVLTWSEDIRNTMLRAGRRALYVLDKTILDTDFQAIHSACRSAGDDCLVVEDLNNLETLYALVSLLREKREKFADVVSCDERTQFAAAVIARDAFAQVQAAECLLLTRDKRMMKNALRSIIKVARHFSVAGYVNDGGMSSLPDGWRFPLVFKPVNRYGSSGTHRVDDLDQLNLHIGRNQASLASFICEEFVNGTEHNVDAIWVNGQIEYFFIGEYVVPRLTGYERCIPKRTIYLPYRDYPELHEKLRHASERVAVPLGIRHGVTHAEFFHHRGELILGEIATRHAGGGMSACIKAAVGESLVELGLRAKLGHMADAPVARAIDDGYIGFVDLRPLTSGVALAVIPREELMRYPGVVDLIYRVRMGRYIEAYGRDSWCVLAIMKAVDKTTLEHQMDRLQEVFWCHTEPCRGNQ